MINYIKVDNKKVIFCRVDVHGKENTGLIEKVS